MVRESAVTVFKDPRVEVSVVQRLGLESTEMVCGFSVLGELRPVAVRIQVADGEPVVVDIDKGRPNECAVVF